MSFWRHIGGFAFGCVNTPVTTCLDRFRHDLLGLYRLVGVLFDYDEAAELLNVSTRTVARMVKDGELVAVRVRGQVRFRAEDLKRYVSEHSTGVVTR